MKFRKKPVVIEAEQWDGNNLASDESLFQSSGVIIKNDGSEFIVSTLEGTMTGQKGDWLIRGVKGELYPCKPDIFAATYDAAMALHNPAPMSLLDLVHRQARGLSSWKKSEYTTALRRIVVRDTTEEMYDMDAKSLSDVYFYEAKAEQRVEALTEIGEWPASPAGVEIGCTAEGGGK